jgi:hypothetical protein
VARAIAAAFVVVATCALVPSASATESTIYPGVGIGKVKLGMTRAQVARVLGKDYIFNGRTATSVELAWDFGSWTVTFSRSRAVQVAVTVPRQKTPAGVGPGSTWHELVVAYPNGVCTANSSLAHGGLAEYLVAHRGGTQTIYYVRQPRRSSPGTPWYVAEVRVRTPWMRLPEFAPSWTAHCGRNWRTTVSP